MPVRCLKTYTYIIPELQCIKEQQCTTVTMNESFKFCIYAVISKKGYNKCINCL